MPAPEPGLITRRPPSEDRFAAYAAHELRTPIALVRLLAEASLSDPAIDARALCEEVIAACDQQRRLIDALLDLTRPGSSPSVREPVDLAPLMGRLVAAHDMGGLELAAALEPAVAWGDPTLLERLGANLICNAIRHNVAGGSIEIATACTAGHARLTVANTGPLISRRRLAQLFEPFQRGPSPAGRTDGLGLGLSIVESVAAAHDAVIDARPRTGGGLVIAVAFPAR